MTQLGALLGLDPAAEVSVLCGLVGLAVAASIVAGFTLLGRAERRRCRDGAGPRDLSLLALWRLGRGEDERRRWSPAALAARPPGSLRPNV